MLRTSRDVVCGSCRVGEDKLDLGTGATDGGIQHDAHSSDLFSRRGLVLFRDYALVASICCLRVKTATKHFANRWSDVRVFVIDHRRDSPPGQLLRGPALACPGCRHGQQFPISGREMGLPSIGRGPSRRGRSLSVNAVYLQQTVLALSDPRGSSGLGRGVSGHEMLSCISVIRSGCGG
jgi:hypothetical protein